MNRDPLVSILIPAYNTEATIGETLRCAVAQSWPRTEIIVVNDGSRDRTEEIARQFSDQGVTVLTTRNRGQSAAVNYSFLNSYGDYIQHLDSGDLLSPGKIEFQLMALRDGDRQRLLLSSPWATFYHRTCNARFVPNPLWEDLFSADWLERKMSERIHMPNHTWLMTRELAEAAGP